MNRSKTYRRGTEITVMQLPELAEKRLSVIVQTGVDNTVYPAFELLDWHLKSLLKVKIFRATQKTRI